MWPLPLTPRLLRCCPQAGTATASHTADSSGEGRFLLFFPPQRLLCAQRSALPSGVVPSTKACGVPQLRRLGSLPTHTSPGRPVLSTVSGNLAVPPLYRPPPPAAPVLAVPPPAPAVSIPPVPIVAIPTQATLPANRRAPPMCCFFLQNKCRYLEKCSYAHVDDGRPCNYGAKCTYGHAVRMYDIVAPPASQPPSASMPGAVPLSLPTTPDAPLLPTPVAPVTPLAVKLPCPPKPVDPRKAQLIATAREVWKFVSKKTSGIPLKQLEEYFGSTWEKRGTGFESVKEFVEFHTGDDGVFFEIAGDYVLAGFEPTFVPPQLPTLSTSTGQSEQPDGEKDSKGKTKAVKRTAEEEEGKGKEKKDKVAERAAKIAKFAGAEGNKKAMAGIAKLAKLLK